MSKSISKPYKRILLKASGELLSGSQSFGIDQSACLQFARAIETLQKQDLEIAIVIGGGNICRGIHLNHGGLERSAADQMGMLGTLINGVALRQSLLSLNVRAKLMSALECPKIAEAYNWDKALDSISSGEILIFVGGTGNPYFTTDTAAALRACEIKADLFVKATKVDGIYDKDPKKFPEAVKYDCITYEQVLSERLGVMDATAIALCQSNDMQIFVLNMQKILDNPELGAALFDKKNGSFVSNSRQKMSTNPRMG